MATKPRYASGYRPDFVSSVRATCLYIATKLGDLADETVVVGGLVPALLIDQSQLRAQQERHVGTLDLDIGLALAVLDHRRYAALTDRLRSAGFEPDANEKGNVTRQRWAIAGPPRVTVDFLIAPSRPSDKGGTIRDIESDLAAVIAPGLSLAFVDRTKKTLSGKTIVGEVATRDVWVCGPAAFIALKALAFRDRGENKDAYDLFYVLRHYPNGVDAIGHRFASFGDNPEAEQALAALESDFATIDSVGPRRTAEFLHGSANDELQADVRGLVAQFVAACRKS
jgi:predicted nucleotidyltransferase